MVERWAAAETGPSFGHPADLASRSSCTRSGSTWPGRRRESIASRAVKASLARESEADHPREALDVYAERVDELANEGGNRAYEEAAGFVVRMGRLRAPAEQTAYVATLKERFSRRRNFMKLLA